jgi:hypothetical protein
MVAAPRPVACTRAVSSLKRATRRCAVSTALVAVVATPSRKKSSHASQSPGGAYVLTDELGYDATLQVLSANRIVLTVSHWRLSTRESDSS